ncbi:VOC family protein [Phenylobacterium sp.]|uniref:VOC family protein n=1 Tax=Phenylobacterium sp. TaxID=1871053 RepID=UPI002DF622E0|nr:VOC family protein [Phenylobacterium sp.]
MAKVLGIGGVFFKAEDPKAVGDWYRRVLGFEIADWGGSILPSADGGFQVWSPFAADTKYFAPSALPFMINLRVDDLDGVLERVKREGVEPLGSEDQGGMGRFAWIVDPAGVKVELWEPAADAPAS